MTGEAEIAGGCARVPGGEWLMAVNQPAASLGEVRLSALRGLFVPDRGAVRAAVSAGDAWCADAGRPFLTRLDAPPDEALGLVSSKLLVAPRGARLSARAVKLVPLSFRRAVPVTEFRGGWAVAATRSRVTRVSVADGGTLSVRPEALVAWIGRDPTGFCRRLGVMDLLLPRGPRDLVFSFHGPAVVWFEGSAAASGRPVRGRRV